MTTERVDVDEVEPTWRRAVDQLLSNHRKGRSMVSGFFSELAAKPEESFEIESAAGAARSEIDTYRWIESVRAGEASAPDSAALVAGLAREERAAAADHSLGLRPGQRMALRLPLLEAQRALLESRLRAEEQNPDQHLEQFAQNSPELALDKISRLERVAFGRQIRLAVLDLHEEWMGAFEACAQIGQGSRVRDPRINRLPELLGRLRQLSKESIEGITGPGKAQPERERPNRPPPTLVALPRWVDPNERSEKLAAMVSAMRAIDAQDVLWSFVSEFRRRHAALSFTSNREALPDPSSPEALLDYAQGVLGSAQGYGEPFEALRHILRACLWLGFDELPGLELLMRAAQRAGCVREACVAAHLLHLRRLGVSREAAPDPRDTTHLTPILEAAAARPPEQESFACYLPLAAAPLPAGFKGDPFRPRDLAAWALEVAQREPRQLTDAVLQEASRVAVRAALMDGCSTVRPLNVVAITYGLRFLRSQKAEQLKLARAAVTLSRALHPPGAEEAERFLDELDPSQAGARKGIRAALKAARKLFRS